MTGAIDYALDRPLELFLFIGVALLVSTFLGAALERRWRPLNDDEQEHLRVIVGAMLTLLGLIIGFSFSMALREFDQRKDYEQAEAGAIGTALLRADLLPPAAAATTRRLLGDYVDLRVAFFEERRENELARINARTTAIQREMWSAVRSAAVEDPTEVVALAVAGMNDVLGSQGNTQAAWWNRIPEGAWALMAAVAISSCALIGYTAGVVRPLLLTILPVILSIALFAVADIDSPRPGLIRVVPRNLISVSQAVHSADGRHEH